MITGQDIYNSEVKRIDEIISINEERLDGLRKEFASIKQTIQIYMRFKNIILDRLGKEEFKECVINNTEFDDKLLSEIIRGKIDLTIGKTKKLNKIKEELNID